MIELPNYRFKRRLALRLLADAKKAGDLDERDFWRDHLASLRSRARRSGLI
jgi:hypothetical protein